MMEREPAEATPAHIQAPFASSHSPFPACARTTTQLNKLTGWRIRGVPAGPIVALAPPHNRASRSIRPEIHGAQPQWPGSQGEAQALLARLRLAPRFHGLPDRALAARILRALLRLHGPLPRRGLAALGCGRAAVGRGDAWTWRAYGDVGTRDPGVPRNLGRRLAEEVGARGHLPRSLRQRGRLARHPAQRCDPAGGLSGSPDQGRARDRGSAFL